MYRSHEAEHAGADTSVAHDEEITRWRDSRKHSADVASGAQVLRHNRWSRPVVAEG